MNNYREEVWLEKAQEVMKEGLFEKFSQNPHLTEALKGTGSNELAESSPTDKYWGTGKSIYDSSAFEKWDGQNHLGKILMQIRTQLTDL